MKQKEIITTLAIAGAIVAAHHSTPTHKIHNVKNPNNREVILLTSQNQTLGEVTNTSFLHFRSGPTTNDSIIRTLSGNQKMIILGTYGDWYKVNINGTIGYVFSYYVKKLDNNSSNDAPTSSQETGSLVNTTFLHLRDSATTNSNILETLYSNDKIVVLGKEGSWYKVQVNGQIGYVYGYYIQASSNKAPDVTPKNPDISPSTNSIGTGHLINTTFLHFRSAATLDSDIISTLSENSQITVIKKVGSWYEVKVDNQVGYVYGYYLSVTPDSHITPKPTPIPSTPTANGIGSGNLINTTFLHLRDRATTNSNILETIYNNDKITVLSKDGNWYKIEVNDQVGYVFGYYLNVNYNDTVTPDQGSSTSNIVIGQVVNSPYLHVRVGAGTNFSILEDIYRGNKVEVMKKVGDWYEIKINGKIGYVYDYYLEIVSGTLSTDTGHNTDHGKHPIKPTENFEHGVVINLTSLNVRNKPGTSSKVLGTLNGGQSVSIISASNGWFKIDYNGQDAYVSANYIKLTSPFDNAKTSDASGISNLNATGTISSYVANIRANASTSATIIGQETINSPVVITGEKDNFYQIKLGNKFGFISKKLITTTGSSEDSGDKKHESSEDTPVNPIDHTTQIKTSYPITLNDYVNMEYNNWPLFSKQQFMNAINPQHIDNMFEFLRIDKFRAVDVSKLNELLEGKGVLSGQGQAFVNACKNHSIDPLYFVNQSILETGYGRSKLARGVTISKIAIQSKPEYNSQGQLVGYQMQQLPHPVTVYNLFGIGAEDNSSTFPDKALVLGTTYAYTHGWTSVASAIDGAAEFVSSNYVNNSYYSQNTVYKLRFSPQISSIWHQYSTNVEYAQLLADLMKEHMNIYKSSDNFTYDVPVFKS
ncbi:SH3 domain-containing protein [uncultured Clostridium sp.]|jgi:beta-N-acetylglucosaminidase/uncharacterized protein YraI|uniref:SH3 domain-containing protein n=1 Tax=uncultured Clostridium sp. TaxID=59620 RepID=UPI00261418F1|nr:SH3 domain-containing protein [uncultured Clostridium sp.]